MADLVPLLLECFDLGAFLARSHLLKSRLVRSQAMKSEKISGSAYPRPIMFVLPLSRSEIYDGVDEDRVICFSVELQSEPLFPFSLPTFQSRSKEVIVEMCFRSDVISNENVA